MDVIIGFEGFMIWNNNYWNVGYEDKNKFKGLEVLMGELKGWSVKCGGVDGCDCFWDVLRWIFYDKVGL